MRVSQACELPLEIDGKMFDELIPMLHLYMQCVISSSQNSEVPFLLSSEHQQSLQVYLAIFNLADLTRKLF